MLIAYASNALHVCPIPGPRNGAPRFGMLNLARHGQSKSLQSSAIQHYWASQGTVYYNFSMFILPYPTIESESVIKFGFIADAFLDDHERLLNEHLQTDQTSPGRLNSSEQQRWPQLPKTRQVHSLRNLLSPWILGTNRLKCNEVYDVSEVPNNHPAPVSPSGTWNSPCITNS